MFVCKILSEYSPVSSNVAGWKIRKIVVDFPIKSSIYSGFPVAMLDDTGG